MSVKYCPADDMIGDYQSVPLQGAKFQKFYRAIMGLIDLIDYLFLLITHFVLFETDDRSVLARTPRRSMSFTVQTD